MKTVRVHAMMVATVVVAMALAGCPATAPQSPDSTLAVAKPNCQSCHSDIYTTWSASPHAKTQTDVASELASSRAGQTPDDVISGPDAEDCIACHGPTAVTANGGVSEAAALGGFFTTTGGTFTSNTVATNTDGWPDVSCTTCHNVPDNHPQTMPTLALFDSQKASYTPAASSSSLCGQCHGTLHFSGTDHQVYDAWAASKHGNTQADVASELASDRAGQTPDEVINGAGAEDCIACHAPTAVLANGGMTEAQALNYFFSTTNGQFTADTTAANTADWPQVGCIACHDPHNPDPAQLSYFNSATGKRESMTSASQLCGQCHGNLRFPDTDHLSYNIMQGTGGIGVADMQTMPGATCTDCHMHASTVDGSNSKNFGGHSFAISVTEADGTATSSCTTCHDYMDAAAANTQIQADQAEFQTLDATAQSDVAKAVNAMQGNSNATLQAELAEAQHNLQYAESDESGGFHNHKYLMSLLNDADSKALRVLAGQ